MKKRRGISAIIYLVVVFVLLVIAGISTMGTWVRVDVGYASVIRNSWDGTLKAGPVGPIDKPFQKAFLFEDVVTIYTAVSSVHMCTGYDSVLNEQPVSGAGCDIGSPIGITKDGIRLAVDVNVFWTISHDPEKLINLYRSYPNLDYKQIVIVPIIREVVRDVVVNRTFDQVFEERSILPSLIASEIVQKVAHNPTLEGIINIDPASIQVLNIHMPEAIQDALQAKKNSEIAIVTAQNQRNVTIINADAQRQQQVLQSQGLAQAKIIQANATREAILTVLQSVGCGTDSQCQQQASELYLTLLQLQELAKSGNVIFLVGLQNGTPFIFQLPTNSTGR